MYNEKVDIVIIGAGPVGMMTAIGLLEMKMKKINSITILESRNLKFTRDEIVVFGMNFFSIDKNLLKTLPVYDQIMSKLKNELTKILIKKGACFVKQPFIGFDATCYTKESLLVSSPLKIIQESILEMLKKRIKREKNKKVKILTFVSGISINDNKITFTKNNKINSLPYHILIGTDGTDSIVKKKYKRYFKETTVIPKSKQIFGGVFNFKIDPRKIVKKNKIGSVNFNVLMDIENNEFKNKSINTFKRNENHIFPQNRIRMFQHKNGYIYIGMALTKKEYNNLNSVNLTKSKLFQIMQKYLSLNNIHITGNNLVSYRKFPIVIKQVIKPFHFTKNAVYFVGGDAAINTHFFTSAGLDRGLQLSILSTVRQIHYILTKAKDSKEAKDKFIKDFIDYNADYSARFINEYSAVKASLDFPQIQKKCKKISVKDLKKRAKTLALNKNLLEKLDKQELCKLVIADSLHKNKKTFSLFPNFSSLKESKDFKKKIKRNLNQ